MGLRIWEEPCCYIRRCPAASFSWVTSVKARESGSGLFLASLRDGGACLTLDLDPNHSLPASLALPSHRSFADALKRTAAVYHTLTHSIPHHTSSQHQSCARPPGDKSLYQPESLRPPSLTLDRPPPKRVPFSLFHLALRDQERQHTPLSWGRDSSQAVWKVAEEYTGELLREKYTVVASRSCYWSGQIHLLSEKAA